VGLVGMLDDLEQGITDIWRGANAAVNDSAQAV
jgi:hypothetical protein